MREVTMTKVSLSTKLAAPADKVWRIIGNFNALPQLLPPVKASKLDADGRVRKLDLADGGSVTEQGFVNLTTQDELIGRARARYAAIPAARRHAAKASLL